ncbi:site-specific integrase [Tamlana sp. s12]|uniref:Site-specific integrase n=1 Tax=Pseudotamlana haliotis TaxID=2614804 RepID=A0A6N6MIR1_9FLAO|nr:MULTISPECIES: site-specific integrase [Tamlana]KAB1068969.1 site-specific integrase [Tamlana haliotis]OBQ54747.1 integrase [Tamlana sp. s12]QQY82239.1 site-specific integrase [Tamlana sp. s12]
MQKQNTFSILFWLQTSRAINNEALIYARITVNGKRLNISLKRKVTVSLWDSSKKRVRGNSIQARQINQSIDQTHTKLFQIYQDLKFKGELITAHLIKSHYTGETNESKSLQELLKYHAKKIENTLAKGSIENFGVTENYINRFLLKSRRTTDIYLNQLDYKFLCDFESYLYDYWPKGHPRTMSQNTVMKHIQRFRKIITLAYHIEWIEKDPFVKWKQVYEKKEREFLSENELSNLETLSFKIERLERVRDLFVFSCYTGISYVDIMQLTDSNLVKGMDGSTWIVTHRQKTKSKVKIPLLQQAENLIKKYENHPLTTSAQTLFPIITNQKLNAYLKELADICGIKKNLTFHMARHTFATTVTLSNGMPIETVSKLLGHTKIATTQIYARVLEDKLSQDMNNLRQQLEGKSKNNDSASKLG